MGERPRRVGSLFFGLIVGLIAAYLAYRWVENPEPRLERAQQEATVEASRSLLIGTLGVGVLEIVDPMSPDRKVGKAYVYPTDSGWQVSGFYRRDDDDLWHPYLMELDKDLRLLRLKVSDGSLLDRNKEPVLEVLP